MSLLDDIMTVFEFDSNMNNVDVDTNSSIETCVEVEHQDLTILTFPSSHPSSSDLLSSEEEFILSTLPESSLLSPLPLPSSTFISMFPFIDKEDLTLLDVLCIFHSIHLGIQSTTRAWPWPMAADDADATRQRRQGPRHGNSAQTKAGTGPIKLVALPRRCSHTTRNALLRRHWNI